MKVNSESRSIQLSAWFLVSCIFLQSFLPAFAMSRRIKTMGNYSGIGYYTPIPTNVISEVQPERIKTLPGGPDQPEVQSFTPIGISDMVDPFTGDFSYNIPLIDVDGYPINLAYSAGVSMDEEASWVGLGWNVNPGVVNRMMRGIPDEFNGSDKITKEVNVKNDITVGVSAGVDVELFGFEGGDLIKLPAGNQSDPQNSFSIGVSLGINYNNYNGFGSELSISPSLNVGKSGKPQNNFGLGLSGSSSGGATISPSYSRSVTDGDVTKTTGVSSAINSRQGFQGVSFSRTKSIKTAEYGYKNRKGQNREGANSVSKTVSSFYNFGTPSYNPSIAMPMNSAGGTFSFKVGGDIFGLDGSATFSGYYSERWLKDRKLELPAYGFLNMHLGQFDEKAMMDFTRENDGAYTKNTPALPIPSLNFDLFSVSGQGVRGSYRAQRNDIGFVFDPHVSNGGLNVSLGAEVNGGAGVKLGIDISASYSNSISKAWRSNNSVSDILRYYQPVTGFREANESSVSVDPSHFAKIGGDVPIRLNNNTFSSLSNGFTDLNGQSFPAPDSYARSGIEKKNQLFHYITRSEQSAGMGVEAAHPSLYQGSTLNPNQVLDHHIGEITVLNVEGARYVYGIAAYNKMQKDVSFAVDELHSDGNCTNGLVTYSESQASTNNESGLDHSFNSVKTPAYAHSFLLTSVLNSDYSDIDAVRGPSKGDLGGYIKFSYKKIDNYKWKTPATTSGRKASFDEGLNSDLLDNKAHYTYGEKELWYVEKIETKNHVLLFYTSDRLDGHGVISEHDVVSANQPSMQKLDSIVLYSLPDYERNPNLAIPLKKVHFVYDYSLCKNYPQNVSTSSDPNLSGKLTLKEVFFTYQNSQKGRYNKYKFDYSTTNPDYNLKAVDRWGNYKPLNGTGTCDYVNIMSGLRPSDYPYVGFDETQVDKNVSAWNLTTIHLPSGGRIEVDYESDDYAYVQHKKANQMFKIVGVQENSSGQIKYQDSQSVSQNSVKNAKIYFEMIPGYDNVNDYVSVGELIYFRTLMNFRVEIDDNGEYGYDFVPGYGTVRNVFTDVINGNTVGGIEFEPATLKDNDQAEYNPIAVAAIQFGRIHLSRLLPPSNQDMSGTLGSGIKDFAESLLGAFTSFRELFEGPNRPLYDSNIGTELAIGKSWLRLRNPNNKKLGGGHRVSEIRIYDAWDELTGNEMEGYHYGQKYTYTLEDGTSSGVAGYEPQMGSDENVWKQPLKNDTKLLLAPDIRNYQETPFGENYFPSPTVGYSRVTIQDLPRPGVTRTATGKVVHEFYTAKDFPTIVKRTDPNPKRFYLPLFAIFFTLSIDEMSASQGFVIEKNDMHGKPKAQYVYAQDQSEPISSVEYFYQHESIALDGIIAKHLTNNATTIDKHGNVSTNTIGLEYEAVADFRKSTSNTIQGSINLNFDVLPIPPVPIPVPSILGSGTFERTAFRSATFTKAIERFGILVNTVARDLGSRVETNNLAYDAETGSVLLTQTTTNFNDKVYSLTYPAHWYYDGMGQAYLNTDYVMNAPGSGTLAFVDGINSNINSANSRFALGDELIIFNASSQRKKAWVTEINENHIKLEDKFGNPITDNLRAIKVYRSGRKNQQSTPIGSLISRTNPLDNFSGNIFKNVLQASAVEFTDEWRTFCECFTDPFDPIYTTNPYVKGLRGNWRPKASFVHLSGRTQEFQNENSNIRQDGVFTSYTPFYKFKYGKLAIDRQNWTTPINVTEFSPFGQALESQDALNRYSASTFGYNQTFALGVGTNSRYSQLGFDGFEDYDFQNCSDNHFKLALQQQIINTQSHTGRHSVKVTPTDELQYTTNLKDNCDPVSCDLKSDFIVNQNNNSNPSSNPATATGLFNVLNGVAPYSFEYEIISGNPTITINSAGSNINITYPTNTFWKVKIFVTDANGCTLIKELQ